MSWLALWGQMDRPRRLVCIMIKPCHAAMPWGKGLGSLGNCQCNGPGGIAAPRVFEERDVHAASCLSSSVINAAPKECSAVLSPGWVGIGRNLAIGSVVGSRAISERSQMNAWAHFLHFELRNQKSERMRRRTEDRRLTCTSDSFLLCRAMRGPR